MSIKIQDGKGSGRLAEVNEKQKLAVAAESSPRAYYVAHDDGECYSWTSSYSATSGDEIIYIKNTSQDKDLHIDLIRFSSVNTALFEVFEVSGTASGTTITGKNTNLSSGNVADCTSLGNAAVTGISIGDRITLVRGAANSSHTINLENTLILGFGDAIAVTYTGSSGIADIAIRGFFE